MTTIAYRNGVMAADSLITSHGSRHGYAQKIFRIDGCLVGLSGECPASMRFLEHFDFDKYCKVSNVVTGMYAIVVRDGEVWMYEDGTMMKMQIDSVKYVAIGSGTPFALGAMAIGAGAERAVRAAIRHDIQSGGKVQVEKVDVRT